MKTILGATEAICDHGERNCFHAEMAEGKDEKTPGLQ